MIVFKTLTKSASIFCNTVWMIQLCDGVDLFSVSLVKDMPARGSRPLVGEWIFTDGEKAGDKVRSLVPDDVLLVFWGFDSFDGIPMQRLLRHEFVFGNFSVRETIDHPRILNLAEICKEVPEGIDVLNLRHLHRLAEFILDNREEDVENRIDSLGYFYFKKETAHVRMGVHSGFPMTDVPVEFYQEMADNQQLPEDLREICRQAALYIYPVKEIEDVAKKRT